MYQVKLEVFEGSFDLLLNLISQQKLDIYEIPLSKITEEYLAYIEEADLDLEGVSEFIFVAATLLDIKASTLFSGKQAGEEESELTTAAEAQRKLFRQLVEYKKFKMVSEEFASRFEKESRFFTRETKEEFDFNGFIFPFLVSFNQMEKEELPKVFLSLLEGKALFGRRISHLPLSGLNLEKKMDFVLERLEERSYLSFEELTGELKSKVEIILVFLALLELYKRSLIDLGQAITFGEIRIKLQEKTLN